MLYYVLAADSQWPGSVSCVLTIVRNLTGSGAAALIALVLLYVECSEKRFSEPAPASPSFPSQPHEQTPVQFLSRLYPQSLPTYLFRVVNLYTDFQYGLDGPCNV